ncbi:glucans biosynthesis glucosyltransferase MdoH [Roseomonas sp. E05]|uniref:glucans biosynthesis glucosyltransferase MdoH n=1 Tax=Roseomonas sp. E05 TaxID=3046310 RepID=UPI0024BBBC0F|nr:glucans biosynthesis glucosyltransferase MdoH [Roseomonas sp. E05]MDJ0387902.1 glucans biosynthesis glucosyltransferase MdoH [Roseomonas sp. E05]
MTIPDARFPAERPRLRRAVFLLLCLLAGAGLSALLWRVLAPGGWTAWEGMVLLAWLGVLPWICLCAGNAVLGFVLRLRGGEPALAVLPQLGRLPAGPPRLSTALALCIRNEDMAVVLPPLVPLLDGLEAAGAGHRFTLWLLSDTREPDLAAQEEAAVAAFAASRQGGEISVRYRRRSRNTGFKAGNVMDFLDHHAGEHALFLCLDADSEMSAGAVLRLVALMEADPKLAIVQHLIAGRPAQAAFPRLFQFGMRAGMRIWATGQAWWQLDQGPYWGHNAILRIAPFRAHARLEALPDGSPILSHDQIEAVRLYAAGWKVRCLPTEEGSLEGNPPTLPDFLLRDRRWGAGNMQYLALLRLPGLSGMGRLQLLQAILLFLAAPLWLLLLAAAVLNAASGGGAATPAGPLLGLMLAAWGTLYAPKLLGYAELLLCADRAEPYGGRAAVLRGVLAEILFTTLLDPVALADKALLLLRLPFGGSSGWLPQNRAARGIRWRDAARLLWPHTLLGLLGLAGVLAAGGTAWAWAAPFLLPLAGAIPFCVLTASPSFAAWLRHVRLCSTPEEIPAFPAMPPRRLADARAG